MAKSLRSGSENEKAVMDFCKQDIPPEGLQCVFGNLGQGGRLARRPDVSISLCNNGWTAPRDCMTKAYQDGVADSLLDISDVCKVKDQEARACVIQRMQDKTVKALTHIIVAACEEKNPSLRSCMMDYVDNKPPFDVVGAYTPSDAHDLCQYLSWAGPEVKACLIHFYKHEPPFDTQLIQNREQASLVCGFRDQAGQKCLLEAIRHGDRKKLTDCLSAKPDCGASKVKCDAGSSDPNCKCLAEQNACLDFVWKQTHSEEQADDICGIANTELRHCIVGKVIDEALPFYQGYLACGWKDVELLLKAAPQPCPK